MWTPFSSLRPWSAKRPPRRPGSLQEVAAWSNDRQEFHYHLADFLDQFRLEPQSAMLLEEPAELAGQFEGGDVCDAYLAAVTVALAREIRSLPPAWAWAHSRRLAKPYVRSPG